MIALELFKLYVFSPLFGVVGATGIVGVICIVLFFLAPAFIAETARAWLGIIGLCCLFGGSAYWVAFHQGENFQALKYAARDAEAIKKVNEGQKAVEACNGGVDWNVVTGTCDK